MTMLRNITNKLIAWKDNASRKPLIIRGARQTGKSYSVLDFGKKYFTGQTHVINLEKNPDFHFIFEQNLDVSRILTDLEILTGKRIVPGQDLLFIDEIQACQKAITALRYFYEQKPELHLIAAGSLLEFSLRDISFPVGRVQLINMNPMNFDEFLIATGNDVLAEKLRQKPTQLSMPINNMIKEELKKYFFIGGMPECVRTYRETNSLHEVFKVQSDLIDTFRQDFSKYAPHSDKTCLNGVFKSATTFVGKQIKYSGMVEDFTMPTIKKAFNLLETARLFKKVIAANPEGLPLGGDSSEKIFKVIMLDIGLLSKLSGINVSEEFKNSHLLSVFNGKMAEQFIGQEIVAAGNDNLFYWSRQEKSSSAETDFLIEKNGQIIPVEVKSGSKGRLKSLHLLLKTYTNIKKAYVFSDSETINLTDDKIQFFPLYYIGSLIRE
ncbi:MAG: ATP-binding protein [Bacteroidales bacterium]|nr:ATP-binding protein [Bacteroidales bacterium]